jgi:DNA helicase-2/ATP-dependent DNA helicase PcrA
VWLKYDATLAREKALDFDDLISKPVHLFEAHPDMRTLVQERFTYIHVDEYQDTNELQGRLANILAEKHRNLFVVGDIDQTIYTWRGATIENLLSFDETYPEAKTIVLEHNYRSSKTIVAASNAIIEKNRNRKEKRAVTDNPDGHPIRLQVSDTAEEEARFIARQARQFMHEGIAPEEIAVLYRTNFQSRVLEEAFLAAGIPYRLLGTRFLDRKEVKDVLAWVRLALEPSRESDRVRAIQAPSRGIGKVTVAKIAAGKTDGLPAAVRAKVEAFESLIQTLHEESKTAAPSAFVRRVIQLSGLEDTLAKGGEDDQERLENAKELATLASRYDHTPGVEGIAAFLADTALAGDQDELDRPQSNDKNKKGVTLMTVHAAKGLEFDAVFVTGLEEGLFPHEGMNQDEERDEEEERRLFYVAMTRAKHHLVLTMARVRRIYGTDYLSEPSTFLHDIDAGLMQVNYGEEEREEVIHI